MYVRYEHPAAVLWESESFDYGKSWTPARPSEIPNPGTKFVIYRIRGRHVLVNNVCTPDHPYRDVLELWVSSDNCATWEKKLPLARSFPGPLQPNGKPAITQVAYPHGFADEKEEKLYLAIDTVRKFYFLKVPFADFL